MPSSNASPDPGLGEVVEARDQHLHLLLRPQQAALSYPACSFGNCIHEGVSRDLYSGIDVAAAEKEVRSRAKRAPLGWVQGMNVMDEMTASRL